MKIKIKIGKKFVSQDTHCFIIAEAGVNHNGKLSIAKKLVDAAKKANADAIKFQTFKTENLVTEKAEMAAYQKRNLRKGGGQYQMLKKIELKYEDFIKLKKYCDQKKIIFLSTPHTDDAVDFLAPLVDAYKIGSGDLTNLPLLKKIATKKKPIILGTGMATLSEVKEAVRVIRKNKNNKIVLLHCTTNYPCPIGEVNLRAMLTLKKVFGLPVGYSDHTAGLLVPTMAVSLGAVVIEKHFTLDKKLPGPDHRASLEPKELEVMIKMIRAAEQALGSGIKTLTKSEEKIKKNVRKSLVARQKIIKGTIIRKNMLIVKRPEGGIPPKFIDRVLGKRASRNIQIGELVTFKMI